MKQQGSEAYLLDGVASPYEDRNARLVAHEGGRLDEQARSGVAPDALTMVRVAVALIVALFIIGSVSVTLTTDTVALLQKNAEVSSQIKEFTAVNDDLRIEYSLLTGSERIARIATQKLGMSYANDAGRISLY
ncbi:MAG: cell division protein FtsL [Coriobacteriales bacterium]|nr:cell division protein FtsL [Coriobacteriales bacterium]